VFARIATFEGGNVDELRRMGEERMADGESGMPEGVSRAMVLQGDRRLFVTFFDSREAMQAAEHASSRWATRSRRTSAAGASPSTPTRSSWTTHPEAAGPRPR